MIYTQGCKGLLQTRVTGKGPYITEKGSLHTKGPYRHGGTTNKELLQTRGPHRQTVHTDKGPLQKRISIETPADAVHFLQTRGPYMIYRQGRK